MPWFKDYKLADVATLNINMSKHLGMELTALTSDSIEGRMPVDHRTQQPFGMLHGGASCVLAETLGSIASNMMVDPNMEYAVGLSITANHLKSAKDGYVRGIAKAAHIGRQTHVWDIEIFNEQNQKVCISRLTTAILKKK